MINETNLESGLFDIYTYDEDDGRCIGIHRMIPEDRYKALAEEFYRQGMAVKVVDLEDGVIVYTLG
jgi:hypothetical protein